MRWRLEIWRFFFLFGVDIFGGIGWGCQVEIMVSMQRRERLTDSEWWIRDRDSDIVRFTERVRFTELVG